MKTNVERALVLVPSVVEANNPAYSAYDGGVHLLVAANPQTQKKTAFWFAYLLAAQGVPYSFTQQKISDNDAFQPLYTTVVEPISGRQLRARAKQSK